MMEPSHTPPQALLEQENAALRLLNCELNLEVQTLSDEIERLKQHNHVLRLKVDAMSRRLFGQSTEQLNPDQLQMVFDALNQESQSAEPKKLEASVSAACDSEAEERPARKKRTFEQLVERLPVRQVIIDPEEVKANPAAWRHIGEEVTKLIDYIPARFECEEQVRRKFVKIAEPYLPPIIAPLMRWQERCRATPAMLAQILSQRFELHLPYYRIEQMCARLGLPISRQTLCGWAGMAHDASALVIEEIKREVFADGYVQCDETPVDYQDPGKEGKCSQGWLWVFYNPQRNICLFVWKRSRGNESLADIVPAEFKGIIQCDGHSAYEAFTKRPERTGDITLAGCMAHARRKFFEARKEGQDAQWVLMQMQSLYRIEAQLREARAGPEQKEATRQSQSRPIMEQIKQRLQNLQTRRIHLPESLTGQAITYALNQWDRLSVYLQDGRVQIDNNLIENAIRPSAIGKKNWLFMGDPETGARAATFYTLASNCHRAGVEFTRYLTDLFTRLPKETNQTIHRLTPKAWAAEQAAAAQALAQNAALAGT